MLVQLSGDSLSTIANIILWVLIIGVAYLVYRRSENETARKKEETRIKAETEAKVESDYKEALRGNDRAKALELGRAYYSSKRENGALIIYDDQALTNDLSTMKSY